MDDYSRWVGRAGAIMLGATAVGSAVSGLFASVDLSLPFWVGGASLLAMLGVVLTFRETRTAPAPGKPGRASYPLILRRSFAIIRENPALLYPMLYLALVPMAALIMQTFFLQPQSVALGVPIAAVGVLVMATQLANMAGSNWAARIAAYLGEERVLTITPAVVIVSLALLAAFQVRISLLWIGVLSFATAVAQPIVLNRVQSQVSDDVRATILSLQSLFVTLLVTTSKPILGALADHFGLPAAYSVLAGGLGILVLWLLSISRQRLPRMGVR